MKRHHLLFALLLFLFPFTVCLAQCQPSSSFGGFYFGQPEVRMPLNMIYFKPIIKSGTIQLEWKTTEEQNSDQFIIEHSPNGHEFEAIGQVPAKGKASSAANQYIFLDRAPLKGYNYYRLIMTDTKGANNYSEVRWVYNGGQHPLTVYLSSVEKTSPLTKP